VTCMVMQRRVVSYCDLYDDGEVKDDANCIVVFAAQSDIFLKAPFSPQSIKRLVSTSLEASVSTGSEPHVVKGDGRFQVFPCSGSAIA
jgi:hypothetical protein